MFSADRLESELPVPSLTEGNSQALCLESTLQELPLHSFHVESSCLGTKVAQIFEKYPLLPGVILLEQAQFLGMISRQRLLEYLIRPQGLELFLQQPLRVLYSYACTKMLVLPATTSIVIAAQRALRRSLDLQSEPLVVQIDSQNYCLLSVHDLNIAYWQIRGIETQVRYERIQTQIIQSEKMASLGRLVDGLAHEILDPVSFIWGNLIHISTYSQQLMNLLSVYEVQFTQTTHEIADLEAEIELDYLRQDFPRTIESVATGAERLKKLATSLQNFCHIDEVYPKPADLHECLDGILLLLKSRLTSGIHIVKNYGHLPPVPCYVGQLSQVFMNILTNAIDTLLNQAITQELASQLGGREDAHPNSVIKPQIEITTQVRSLESTNLSSDHSRWVSIRIANNGPSLTLEIQKQILESFSIRKRAAKETSLAMSYQIVTAKHGGKFYLRSPRLSAEAPQPEEVQQASGTEFEILLPLI